MAKNPLRLDPTRTALLRRQFSADITARFTKVGRAIWQGVVREDMLGLNAPVVNAPRFHFSTKPQKIKRFRAWLKEQIDNHILEVVPQTGEPKNKKPWFYKYIISTYKKGRMRAYTDARPQLGKPVAFYEGSKAEFLEGAFGAPVRLDKLELIYTRAYEDLKGITAAMSTQIGRSLAGSVANGDGALVAGRKLSKVVKDITRKRAQALAQTELISVHAEGQLDSFEDLGVETVGAETERVSFSTSDDDLVCPICRALEGKVYTIKQARGVIPVHVFCRCSWLPVIKLPKGLRKKKTV